VREQVEAALLLEAAERLEKPCGPHEDPLVVPEPRGLKGVLAEPLAERGFVGHGRPRHSKDRQRAVEVAASPGATIALAGTRATGSGPSCRVRAWNSLPLTVPVFLIMSCRSITDCSSCSGRGGQPGRYRSTGRKRSTPCTTA